MEEPDTRMLVWALIALIPFTILFFWSRIQARVMINDTGLTVRIPRWLKLLVMLQSSGNRDLSWDQIHKASLKLPGARLRQAQDLNLVRLTLETDHENFSINPWLWVDPDQEDHRLSLSELGRLRHLAPQNLIERTRVVRALQAHGISIQQEESTARPFSDGYDLTNHKGLVIQLGLLTIAGLYAVGDTFFINAYKPLESMPVAPFVLAGIVGIAIAAPLGREAPRMERIGVGALTVAAMVAATYPGLIRFNAVTGETRTVQYEAVEPGLFRSPNAPLPDIDLRDKNLDAYWKEYPPGRQHPFELLSGDAGFVQLDLKPLHRRTRAFYQERRAGD